MEYGKMSDALEVRHGGPRQAYTSKWKGKSVKIVFDGQELMSLYAGHGVIDADVLLGLLNGAYFEGYSQRIREEI